MRIFISTGEVSGDLQGALLIEALKRQAVAAEYRVEIIALGGDRMASAGAQLLGNTMAIGSVGIWESLPYVLPTFLLQRKTKQYLRQHPPDLVVLLDYPGPNLSIGAFCRRYLPQVPIVYYIAPQTWVWSARQRETEQFVRITDLLLAVFPEEARYFAAHGAKVTWVGHPLIDRMQAFPRCSQARTALGIDPGKKAIALIPASRRQELKYLMPVMFAAAKMIQSQLTDVHFWIPLSREGFREPMERAIGHYGLQATISSQTKEVLAAADLAIAKSGTVNLELALLDVPQVVIYRVSPITGFIARKLLNFSIPFMSPPNLVAMKQIVPEFLQEEATPEAIFSAGMDLLANPVRQQMLADYQQMRQSLGEPGVADRAAIAILGLL